MATFNPHLHFSGNTEEAFNFYKSVFGGELLRHFVIKTDLNLMNTKSPKST